MWLTRALPTPSTHPRSPLPYGGHGGDRGFNALALRDAANVWVRGVTVLNADNAALLERVDHASLLGACKGAEGVLEQRAWVRDDLGLVRLPQDPQCTRAASVHPPSGYPAHACPSPHSTQT